jgi:hypothetical protein
LVFVGLLQHLTGPAAQAADRVFGGADHRFRSPAAAVPVKEN